jgi:hypothetical protein
MSTSIDLLRFFETISSRHIELNLDHIDVNALKTDKHYALKVFLSAYAFARAGAPFGYTVAAIKAAESRERKPESGSSLWPIFKDFYGGKLNINANPCSDPSLSRANFSEIVKTISEGDLPKAFRELAFRGVKHKIRTLFIRDIAYLTNFDTSQYSKDKSRYLFAQPVDTWVRQTAQMIVDTHIKSPIDFDTSYYLNRVDFRLGACLVSLCLDSDISPLKTNMGIWYFCSRVVGDATRLRKLLEQRSVDILKSELDLIEPFLP